MSIEETLNKQLQESFERTRDQTTKEKAIILLAWHLGCDPEDILDVECIEENGSIKIRTWMPKEPVEKFVFKGIILEP